MDPLFEKNKKELLEKLNSLRLPNDRAPSAAAEVIVYGAHCLFIDTLTEAIGKQQPVAAFADIEAATEYCLNNTVYTVIMDMDPPTDWKMSTDLFTTVKTVKPKVRFIVLTMQPRSIPVQTIAAQSVTVLEKPFGMPLLLRAIKSA
jgi:DNA-binding NarL/FixJ family response regulator